MLVLGTKRCLFLLSDFLSCCSSSSFPFWRCIRFILFFFSILLGRSVAEKGENENEASIYQKHNKKKLKKESPEDPKWSQLKMYVGTRITIGRPRSLHAVSRWTCTAGGFLACGNDGLPSILYLRRHVRHQPESATANYLQWACLIVRGRPASTARNVVQDSSGS